jgi:hypothetical protein
MIEWRKKTAGPDETNQALPNKLSNSKVRYIQLIEGVM